MTSTTTSLTTPEDIIKYQQELMSFQRNQKEIQKETVKLLNTLNKTLSLMLDRLDEFALRTNIKLDETAQHQTLNPSSASTTTTAATTTTTTTTKTTAAAAAAAAASTATASSCATPSSSAQHASSASAVNNRTPETIFITTDSITNSLNSICNTVNNLAALNAQQINSQSNNTTSNSNNSNNSLLNSLNNHSNNASANKNEIVFISDLTPVNFLDTSGSSNNNNSNNNNNNNNGLNGHSLATSSFVLMNGSLLNNINRINNINSPVPANANKEAAQSTSKSLKDEEKDNQQRLFNKFVRESVEKRLGKDFLLFHEIQEIDSQIMEEIKKEALQAYPPIHIRPRRAWHLAKASLRCRRRSLKRQLEKQISAPVSINTNTSSTSQPDSHSPQNSSTASSSASSSSTPNQTTIAILI